MLGNEVKELVKNTHTHTKGVKTYIGVMKTRAITILDDRYYDMVSKDV